MENIDNIIVKQTPFFVESKDEELSELLSRKKGEDVPLSIKMINAPFMWSKGITGKGVKIAVIDTGCDMSHKDLKKRIVGGRNFTLEDKSNPNKYHDYNGHGTHVCGIIAASNNRGGIVGVSPEAKLLILKALDKNGSGSLQSIIDAVNFAIAQNVDIISMSLGTSSDDEKLHEAIKKAIDQNILVVCAAGNGGDDNPDTDEYSYPAGYNEVISVGAVDYEKSAARFTHSNKEIDVTAPGVDIVSTYLHGKFASLSGTSMATPHVTGALALLIQWSKEEFGRKLSEAEMYGQLIKNTDTLDLSRNLQGNGFLYLDD